MINPCIPGLNISWLTHVVLKEIYSQHVLNVLKDPKIRCVIFYVYLLSGTVLIYIGLSVLEGFVTPHQ